MSEKVIETQELTVYYGKNRGIIDVNLVVEKGELWRLETKADWARRAAVWLRQLEKEQPQFLNRGTWLEFRALLSELDDE